MPLVARGAGEMNFDTDTRVHISPHFVFLYLKKKTETDNSTSKLHVVIELYTGT